jgi:hypothetical protein
VLLDQLSPDQGAFAHALNWAERLELSIRGLLGPGWSSMGKDRNQASQKASGSGEAISLPTARAEEGRRMTNDLIAACAAACGRRVPWEGCPGEVQAADRLPNELGPGELLVRGSAWPAGHEREERRQTVLVCPPVWKGCDRALVLDEDSSGGDSYLISAVELCQSLRAEPFVLTVSRSPRAAWRRQQAARAALARSGRLCALDSVIGAEVGAAVAHVARWRRCPLVLTQRRAAVWWRWWRGDTADKLLGLTGDVALLTFPGAGVHVPHDPHCTPPASRDVSSTPVFHGW